MFQVELKQQRERRGMSQQALSEVLEVSQGAVGLWESGRREPNFDMLIRLAKLFGVTTDKLLGLDNGVASSEHPCSSANSRSKNHNGPTSELSDTEERLIELFRSLSPQGQDYIFQQMGIATQVYTKNASVPIAGAEAG